MNINMRFVLYSNVDLYNLLQLFEQIIFPTEIQFVCVVWYNPVMSPVLMTRSQCVTVFKSIHFQVTSDEDLSDYLSRVLESLAILTKNGDVSPRPF